MSHPVADIFRTAGQWNHCEEHRVGNVLMFREAEHLVVAGDIHGHRENLAKVIRRAALDAGPANMLVLQEIIHGGAKDPTGGDRSFELLVRAARLKGRYPGQVHFLMGNHDVAQVTGNDITKNGTGVCKGFHHGLVTAYGDGADEVADAIREFLLSMPLAGRCPNGVFLSHSLPSPGRTDLLNLDVFHKPYQEGDFSRGQAIYELLWGRRHNPTTIRKMADLTGAKVFINGHQPQESGYAIVDRQLIIMSDHSRGVIAEFDADEEVAQDRLSAIVRRIAGF